MKKNEVTIGGTYLAKVTDRVVTVRIDAENRHGGWDATNLETGKKVRIKSPQRLRGTAPEAAAVASPQATEAATSPERMPLRQVMKPAKTPGKISGLDAAYQVLKDAGQPMRCKDMVDKMLTDGLWKTDGKTPSATIYAAILREITTKGDQARFRKTDRGLFSAA